MKNRNEILNLMVLLALLLSLTPVAALAQTEVACESDVVVQAVDALSRREGESYEAFIQRLKPNPLAVRVKLQDLLDNMDIRRSKPLQEGDLERLQRYQNAWWELTGGNG